MAEASLGPDDPFLQKALVALNVGVVVADAAGRITFLNQVVERATGWTPAEASRQHLETVFRLGQASNGLDDATEGNGGPRLEEGQLITREGRPLPIEYSVSQLRDRSGRARGLVIALRTTSESRLMSLHLERVGSFDLLSGLLNRHAFLEHLGRALEASHDGGDTGLLLFLDIDQFKLVNDTCGHAAGDELLSWVAELLREVAGERDVLARLGGDEFALLVSRPNLEEGIRFAEQVQRRLQEYLFTWEDKSFGVSACIGVAPLGRELSTAAQALAAADHACYMAKEKGRNGLQLYQQQDAEVARRRAEMEWMARINQRLEGGQVMLYAQPIRPLSPMALRGLQFEVLLRMKEPDGRIRTAGPLVAAAERFGLMNSIDRWVISSTLGALHDLEDEVHRIHMCCINLSGLSLRDDSVVAAIRSELAATGIPPHKICFEITETAAVQNLQHARWLMVELSSIGCNLSIDDFGTGVASYSYLKELPVNYLKVAGNFVEGIPSSALDRAMVESINQISHLLGVETIAENVASRDLYDQVRAIGVDHAQGYWIGVPRPLMETCRPVV